MLVVLLLCLQKSVNFCTKNAIYLKNVCMESNDEVIYFHIIHIFKQTNKDLRLCEDMRLLRDTVDKKAPEKSAAFDNSQIMSDLTLLFI